MLYVDKHRPTLLSDMAYHQDISKRLQNLAKGEEVPHLLVYGPNGSGKKTRIMAFLRELYGKGASKVRLEHKTFTPSGSNSTKIQITTVASNYHIEMNPSDVGNKDRFVVQEVLKEMASYHLMDTKSNKNFKVVILNEADRLSKQAQQALRRTMEKHTASCRLILCCNSSSKIIDPLRSRCVGIRVGAPQQPEMIEILKSICFKETFRAEPEMLERIVQASDRNLRRAILMLEACKVQQSPLTAKQDIQIPEWEEFITKLSVDILREQSPGALLRARDKVYELLSNCIPAEVILKTLCQKLLIRLDDDVKHDLIHWAAYYEHRLQLGSKDIFHIEAFIAKFMSIYKKFLLELYG